MDRIGKIAFITGILLLIISSMIFLSLKPVTAQTYSVTSPSAPTMLTATAMSSSQINLSWTAPSNNGGAAITGYEIERSNSTGIWSTVKSNSGSTSTTYSDTGLLQNTTYTYRVSAINSVGIGPPSNIASATTLDISIPNPITTASPAGGTYATSQTVTLTTDHPATIYYTTDGTDPRTSSASSPSPLTLPQFTSTTTLKFFAIDASGNREPVKTETYTINIPPPPLISSATVELNQKVYTWTGAVEITVVAPDHNLNPNLIDTIGNHGDDQVQICTREQCIPYQLEETGPNTGIFTGYVILTGDPAIKGSIGIDGMGQNPTGITSECKPVCGPRDGKLAAEDLDGIRVSFVNVNGQPPVISSAPIRWNIGELMWSQPSYQLNGQGILTIIDPDMNLNPDAIDSFTTKVWSSSDTAGTEITMNETGENTAIFQGKVVFSTSSISSGNTLQVKDGDTVTGQYIDRTLPQPYTPKDQLLLTATTHVGTLQPPVAKIIPLNSSQIWTNSITQFSGSESYAKSGTITSYGWDFGDGQTDNGVNVSHIFQSSGTYTVTLTVTDSNGLQSKDTFTVNVKPPIQQLTASASSNIQSGNAPSAVSFTGAARGGVPPYTWSWNFGDGSTSTEQNPNHTFSSAGTYTVSLIVTDSRSMTVSAIPITISINSLLIWYVIGGLVAAVTGISIILKIIKNYLLGPRIKIEGGLDE